jgi:serine/threonine protein kinase
MKFDFLKNLFENKRVPRTDITKRFDLIGRVGQGSMSRVWRARDTLSGKIVALKVLDKEKTKKFEARFAPELKKPSEGEIAVTLRHPHIVRAYEWGITREGEQFLVMEYVDGLGLSYLVDVQNDTMQKHRLSFMIHLGEAIRYFHDEKWIHRDICPRNVMVTDGDLQVKLIDFGLVVPNTPPFQAPGNRTGTANYMAPELIKRQKTDQRIDVFSYAVTCYEMFTRRYPWKAAESIEMVLQHINSPPLDVREAAPGIDEQVATAIMKGLRTNPNDRWPAISPMLYQFREAQERLAPTKTPRPKRTPAETPTARPAAAKTFVATPGITLADEGITLADEPQPEYKPTPKPAAATAGISLAEDEPQPEYKPRPKPAAPTPGITLAEDEPQPQEPAGAKSENPVAAAPPANPGITLAEDEPQPDEPPPVKALKPTAATPPANSGITLAEDEPAVAAPATAPLATQGITPSSDGITLADDEPQPEYKPAKKNDE